MIVIKNTQRAVKLDIRHIKNTVQKILSIIGYDDFDIGIWFTTNKTIQKYNATYRAKNKPTDILSFSYHPDLAAGQKIKVNAAEDKNLGDLILSPEYIQKTATEMQQLFQERLEVLLVHGICHLLGYDHERDEDFKKMQRKEQMILKKLKNY